MWDRDIPHDIPQALGWRPLRLEAVRERPLGSFHPLVAVSAPEDPLAGHAVAVSSPDRRLLALLRRMAEDLSMEAIEVPEATRAAYHVGAVLAAGGAVGLLSAAVQAFPRPASPSRWPCGR